SGPTKPDTPEGLPPQRRSRRSRPPGSRPRRAGPMRAAPARPLFPSPDDRQDQPRGASRAGPPACRQARRGRRAPARPLPDRGRRARRARPARDTPVSPRDKIVWDTGHQAYVHKMLTGRRDQFHTLRQFGGISGFLVRTESEHDQFGAGHAGTSLSAAQGMAIARDLKGEDHHVVAVIGDGALTAGMAFEAMNNIGHMRTRVIVVLNDNGMSIAPNVGAVSR